jgi:adenylate cyclase
LNDLLPDAAPESPAEPAAPPAEIRAALDAVLASPEFAASPQLSAFLSYVVLAHLAGDDHLLKGQNIGSAVLGRPVDFDSQRDPIVRVEANRLRRTLQAYYQGNGADDPIRFVVSRGSYVPRFERAGAARPAVDIPVTVPPEPPPEVPVLPPPAGAVTGRPWRNRLALVILAVAVASIAMALIGAFTRSGLRVEPAPSVASGGAVEPAKAEPYLPSIEVRPFVIHAPDEVVARGRELVSTLTVALARFPELRVLAPGSTPADFRLDGEITRDGAKSNVTMRLSVPGTAEVIWSADVVMSPEERATGSGVDRLVAIATTAIAPQFGVIAQYLAREEADGEAGGRKQADYDCMINAQLRRHFYNDEKWQRLDACLRGIIERYPNFATAIASRSLLLIEGFRLDPDKATAATALAEADALARRALQIEPTNIRAMAASVAVALGKDDLEIARNMGLRAVSANPLDPLSRLHYVVALLVSGYFDQALAQSAIARQIDPAHAAINDALDYLAYFGIGAEPNPLHGAVIADAPSQPFGLIARILAYDRAGQVAERDQARAALYEIMPLFAEDMPAALRQQFTESPFTQRIETALRTAEVGGR